jgi:uncharacterized protein
MPDQFLHGVEVLEVTDGKRPIRSAKSSVIGLVGTALAGPYAPSTRASNSISGVTYTFTNGWNGVTAIAPGQNSGLNEDGNDYQIRILQGAQTNATTVARAAKIITITLKVNETAAGVAAAVNAATATVLIRAVADSPTMAQAAPSGNLQLIGGNSGSSSPDLLAFPFDVPVLVTASSPEIALLPADSYLAKSLAAIFKQAGAVVAVVRTETIYSGTIGGSNLASTGVFALKKSRSLLGLTPRILLCENSSDVAIIGSLKSVAASLRAVIIAGLSVSSIASAVAATAWSAANGNERVYSLWPSVNGGEDAAPYAAGAQARSDNERGFWWSLSNQEIFGINSLDAPVDWELGNQSSLANILNEGNVATFIREGGFRLWGNRTGSIDQKWAFLCVRRTADIINDSILRAHLWAVDRNITKTYLEEVTESVNGYLRNLENQDAILGGKCWPDPELNSAANITQGKVFFNFDFTPPYPAEHVTFRSQLVNDYISELV